MAKTLNGSIELSALFDLINTLDLGADAKVPLQRRIAIPLTNGAGLNQASEVFFDERTLAGGATENLDLAGVLVDALGNVLSLTKVKALVFFNLSTSLDKITIGNHATAAFLGPFGAAAHTVDVPIGGLAVFVAPTAAGWAVTAGTADMIKVLNGAGGSSTYQVVIIGA